MTIAKRMEAIRNEVATGKRDATRSHVPTLAERMAAIRKATR